MKFAFKLIKHGGIFLLRVVGILVPASGGALSPTHRSAKEDPNEWFGIPDLDAVEHPLWDETYGQNRKPW
jgi:hypothetical protein